MAQGRIWKLLSSGTTASTVFEEELLVHLDALYSLACRLTRDTETAADLLQDTALRAFQKHHQLRHRASMRPWLVRIMTTTYLNRHVRQKNLDELTPETEPISFTTPESELLRRSSAKNVEISVPVTAPRLLELMVVSPVAIVTMIPLPPVLMSVFPDAELVPATTAR